MPTLSTRTAAPTELALGLLRELRPPRPAPRRPAPHSYRSIWISDVHLGTRSCKAEALLDFLDHVDTEHLYLVGDVIDEWKLRRSWVWPASHQAVLERFACMARRGTRVTYVPGNHDAGLRILDGLPIAGFQCRDEVVHETAEGRRLLVLHGDQFDEVSNESSIVARTGELAYGLALGLNDTYNRIGRRFGLRYRSISLTLKQAVKEAVSFMARFEQRVAEAAAERGLDGVVCGHIHKAELRTMKGVLYANDGDWVESCTALVEHACGRLEVVQWRGGQIVPLADGRRYAAPDARPVLEDAPVAV